MTLNVALQTLELQARFTRGDLKKAYREAHQVWHPDRFPAQSNLQSKASARTQQINEAYDYLLRALGSSESFGIGATETESGSNNRSGGVQRDQQEPKAAKGGEKQTRADSNQPKASPPNEHSQSEPQNTKTEPARQKLSNTSGFAMACAIVFGLFVIGLLSGNRQQNVASPSPPTSPAPAIIGNDVSVQPALRKQSPEPISPTPAVFHTLSQTANLPHAALTKPPTPKVESKVIRDLRGHSYRVPASDFQRLLNLKAEAEKDQKRSRSHNPAFDEEWKLLQSEEKKLDDNIRRHPGQNRRQIEAFFQKRDAFYQRRAAYYAPFSIDACPFELELKRIGIPMP